MSSSLMPISSPSPDDLAEIEKVAAHLVKSGFFPDARDVSRAVAKILFGRAIGLDALSSMTGIQLVQGKPQLSAGTMARLIKGSGRYRYTIDELTDKVCTITLYERVDTSASTWEWFKHQPFTRKIEEYAHLVKLNDTWRKYPRNMLFARTISDVAKMLCPEVFGGSSYLPDELPGGYPVDGETLEPTLQPMPRPAPSKPTPSTPTSSHSISAEEETTLYPTDDELAGLKAALENFGLSPAWAMKALSLPTGSAWSLDDMTAAQALKLRNALTVYAETKGKSSLPVTK